MLPSYIYIYILKNIYLYIFSRICIRVFINNLLVKYMIFEDRIEGRNDLGEICFPPETGRESQYFLTWHPYIFGIFRFV